MDLTRAPGFKRRPIAPIANGITETGKSPLPPSLSPSSPSSPSSSSSSSPGAVATGCRNEGKGHAEGSGANRVPGDVVSSTSASLALNTTTPPFTASHSSFHFTSPDIDGQRDRTETEIYDPFYPTDGEREGCVVEEEDEEEEEDEKYDPFDPTGSPASNVEEDVDIAETGQGARRKSELESAAERGGENDEIKEEAPSYSTDIFFAPPTSPRAIPLPLRKRLDWDKNKPKELSRGHERKVTADSDHSEIEEGEIVGAADRDSGKRSGKGFLNLPLPSVGPFLGRAKPERILRVLEGDSFVSLRAEGDWVGTSIGAGLRDVDMDAELDGEPLVVGVEDLRRKLVSRRKERYRSGPPSSLSPPPNPVPLLPPPSSPTSSIPHPTKQESKSHKSSKTSKERERRKKKVKECKAGEKEERKRKKRKEKEDSRDESREKGNTAQDGDRKSEKEEKLKRDDRGRSSRSDSRKRNKWRHSSPETLHSRKSTGRQGSRHSWSSPSEDRHRDRERDRDKEPHRDRERERDKEPDRDRERERDKEPDRDRERDRDQDRDRRRDYRDRDRDKDSRCRKRDRGSSRHKSSKERVSSRISKSSRQCHDREEERERDRERQRDRDSGRRRDGRPVVPPSIQDLNGSDLFAIKRTITVTTTTTTTTVPGSPTLAPASSCSPSQGSDKPHKRKKKRRRRSDEREDGGSLCNPSLSPSRYQGYDSDPYSDKLEIDLLSLDGEALDSDYPSLEDSPLATQLLQPLPLSPKPKSTPKSNRHHPKKSRTGKKSELSSLIRVRGKGQSLLSPTQAASVSASILPALPAAKRRRKSGKDKEEGEKRKDSGKSKKLSGGSRKSKLQSKVSVLVREGVSSTTGASGASAKLGMELHGASGPVGVTGGPVVGGSIAVVFRRDNESRSPFLKPCSEPLSLGGRSKDPSKLGKRSSLAGHPSTSLSNAVALKSKKAKPSSTTSTSSSASSPSSSLATKRRRRIGKKIRDKSETGRDSDVGKSNVSLEALGGVPTEVQPSGGGATKSLSPHCSRTCPAPCYSSASSSSSTSIPPPSSSPPHTPPPLMPPSRETRESSPDSQTVDSSCKTPEPSFLPEDCPTQTTPNLPTSSPPSLSNLPTSLSASQSGSIVKPLSLDEGPKSLASPPCSSSSCGSAPPSLSLPTSSAPPSLSLPTSSADPSSSSSSSVSSSSANKPPPPPPPPPIAPPHPWSLQTGVDCTAGGVLALTALLFKMEEANIASRAKAQEFIQATSQILSQANHNQLQQFAPPSSSSSCSSQIPPPPSLPPGPSPAQFILHSSLPMVGCTKALPSSLHSGMSMGGGCAQTPPHPLPIRLSGSTGSYSDTAWDNESKDPDKYLKKLHTQERAVEEVKLAIKPYYQRKDINKDDYKDILRKAVHKICHSRTGEINPVKVSNLVKLYVQRYKYFRKHGRKMDEEERDDYEQGSLHSLM